MRKIIYVAGILGIFINVSIFVPTVSAAYFDATPVTSCNSVISSSLSSGSRGNQVVLLQNFLNRAGYLDASPNGNFGPATRAAVKAFQRDNSINPTGTVGEATRNALNERLCDTDVSAHTDFSYDGYGHISGSTYVDPYDAYVHVVNPPVSNPTVYQNPQTSNTSYITSNTITPNAAFQGNTGYANTVTGNTTSSVFTRPAPDTIASTNLIYTPSLGYIYSVIPRSGSLTILNPRANAVYKEGDTVSLSWTTNNLTSNQFQIVIENMNSRQSRAVAFTTSNQASFVLTKDLLDTICASSCDGNNGAFRFIIATPTTDIVGATSVLRASVDNVKVLRPFGLGTISLTSSKTPVDSGEIFKLFVNVPRYDTSLTGGQNLSFKVRAICVSAVAVSIAGVPCGQDLTLPLASSNQSTQQEIPVKATNTTFYRQDITFEIAVINSLGQIIATSNTIVTVNQAPFGW